MNFDSILSRDSLEIAIFLIQLIGVPIGIAVFVYGKLREIRDRENGTYSTLGDKYESYLRLCLENDDLPIFDAAGEPPSLDSQRRNRTQIALCVLTSIFEQAFLLYRDTRSSTRRKQWLGWDEYIQAWMGNSLYRELWPHIRTQFDRDFVKYAEQFNPTEAPGAVD